MATKRPISVPAPEKKDKVENTVISLVKKPKIELVPEEELTDLKLICVDGELMVQRYFFCIESEVFRRMLKSGMSETQKNEVKTKNFPKKVLEKVYSLLKIICLRDSAISLLNSPSLNDLKKTIELMSDCCRFAHQYRCEKLLYALKLLIVTYPPYDEYFKLDSELSLDLRKALLHRWITVVQEIDENIVYSDPQIYLDLWEIAVENRLCGYFAKSFLESGLNPEIFLVKDVRIFPAGILIELFDNKKQSLGFSILAAYISEVDSKMASTRELGETYHKKSEDWLERAREQGKIKDT